MLKYSWSEDKNKLLKQTRGIGFEQVVDAITNNQTLIELKHTNQSKYKNQKILVVKINDYAYCVPCIKKGQQVFLKTIYASRKYKKLYLEEEK